MGSTLRMGCLGAIYVLASCAASSNDAAKERDNGAGGSAGGEISIGDSGAPSGEADPCNGYDDDGNGRVDEGCPCGSGDKQACFPWKPGEDPVCAPAGEQICEGSGEFAAWGDCVMAASTEGDSLCSWWVVGANANDQVHVGDGIGWGDATGDGDADFVAPSVNGQLAGQVVGAAYVLFGSPSLHGKVLDLATQPLTGSEGYAVDNFVAEAAHGHRPTSASFGDFDGDGLAEAVGTDSASSLMLVRGSKQAQPLYDASHEDGVLAAKLTGAGASWTVDKASIVDFDADGHADIFAAGWNSGAGAPFGLAVWFGRPALTPEVAADANVPSGIGVVGVASLGNFTAVAGAGDFDNDGYLDLTSMNGAANDCQQIPQKTYVWYGNPERALPSAMNALDGTNGTVVGGGTTRVFGCSMGGSATVSGVDPNHQHADVDGDGIDDLLTQGVYGDAYLFFGKSGGFGPSLDAVQSPAGGVSFAVTGLAQPSYHSALGVGDIDADGFDDIVLPTPTELWIWWGRAGASGNIDLEAAPDKSVIPHALLGDAGGLIVDGKSPSFASVGDLDGDGFGDVVLGFPNADSKNGNASGAGVVIFGAALYGMHSPKVIRRGSGKDTIAGTPEVELIASGRGDDTIDAGGGADAIAAGQGDDRITLSDASFRRLDAGYGTDTLVLAGSVTLDFRNIGRARVQGFERFDLTAPGTQLVSFNAGDLTAMSTTARDFFVLGSAEDGLTLEGGFAKSGSDADGSVVFSRGALRVHVSAALAAKTKLVP